MGDSDISVVADALAERDVLFVVAPSDAGETFNSSIMSSLATSDSLKTIYVTVGRPYAAAKEAMAEEGVDTDNIFFIDCSKEEGHVDADNCVNIDPEALTDISIAMTRILKSLPDDSDKLLVFDTLSTLLLYNNEDVVGKFAHSVVGKAREHNVKSILLTLKDDMNGQLSSRIKQFCDETIEFD